MVNRELHQASVVKPLNYQFCQENIEALRATSALTPFGSRERACRTLFMAGGSPTIEAAKIGYRRRSQSGGP